MPYYVLADIHGRADLLEGVLRAVDAQTKFVFIGDAFDRGPRNRDAMRLLTELHAQGRMIILKGNHENMAEEVDATYDRFQREKDGPQGELRRFDARVALENWIKNGADTVIPEYGGWDSDPNDKQNEGFGLWGLPEEILGFCRRCEMSYRHAKDGGDILCVHAAPPVTLKGHRSIEEAMIWARPEEGPFRLPDGVKLSVHGHTPIRIPMRLGDNVFIDLGAVWTGHLCAFDLETETITVFQGDGHVPLENLPVLEKANGVSPVTLDYTLVKL